MKIIYVHHADRERNKDVPRQEQDITENGIIEAELLGQKLKNVGVTAIYSSPYLRCVHTSNIIGKYCNAPIYKEDRLNEMQNGETWKSLQKRTFDAIDDIIKKHNDDDIILCVTSGVNLSAFIFYFTNIEPSNDNPWIQAVTCSPVLFSTDNKCF